MKLPRLPPLLSPVGWPLFRLLVVALSWPLAGNAEPVACPTSAGGVDLTRPPYSAARDGSADASSAFKAAIADPNVRVICLPAGQYRVDEQVLMRTGQDIGLLGLSTNPTDTRIVWKAALIAFFSNPTTGAETRIRRFWARNVTFDGSGADGRALNLLAAPGGETSVEIENAVIQNTANLPIWIEGFSRVKISRTKFLNTKDPGILRSTNIEIVDNEVSNSSDNCLSISRGNSKVLVARNTLSNCKSAGIFVGGINYEGRTKRNFELDVEPGASTGAGCTVRSLGSDYFRYGMIGTQLTLRRGPEFAIIKITGWNEKDKQSAPCTLVTSVPVSLARKATQEWFDGPHFGGEQAIVENNTIVGTQGHGITLSLGVRDVVVRNNSVRLSGQFKDVDGKLVEKPAFGVVVLGWYLGREEGAHRYAENIEVVNNTILQPSAGGIRLGSETTGGVRRVVVKGNRIELSSPEAHIGVLVDKHRDMPSLDNQVVDNKVVFAAGAKPAIALRVDGQADEACRALSQATVPSMVNGTCALRVGNDCVAATAPATMRCRPGGRER